MYNIIGNMSSETLTAIGDLFIMLMILGSGVLFVWANANYIPPRDEEDDE